MSYLVLARKWRPQGFDAVTGQEHVTRTLTNAIRLDRVAHAFLFCGARGVGKTSTARIFAKCLNCEIGPTDTPCNTCPSCKEITAGTSMDVFEIDGASNRGIGEIRELRDGVKYAPSRDRRKIYIIDEVHMLTTEAFNALLKTLEEPPKHVVFILATTEPQKIPVTILSRCQRFDFKRIPSRVLIARLMEILSDEDVRIEEGALHIIARESEGSMRDALSLLDQIISACGNDITLSQTADILGVADRKWLHDLMIAVLSGDAAQALSVVNDVYTYGTDVKHFSAQLVHFVRDIVVIRVGGDNAHGTTTDLSESEFALLKQIGMQRAVDDLNRYFRATLSAAQEINQSRFPKLVLEMLVVRLCTMQPLQPIDDLLQRLEMLEKRLPDGFVVPNGGIAPGPKAQHKLTYPGQPAGNFAAAPMVVRPTPDAIPTRSRPQLHVVSPPEGKGTPTHDNLETKEINLASAQPVTVPVFAPAPPPTGNQRDDGVSSTLVSPEKLNEFRLFIKEQDAPLAGTLSQAQLSSESGAVVVQVKTDLYAQMLAPTATGGKRLRELMRLFFGSQITVRVEYTENEFETEYELRHREKLEEHQRLKAEARNHPLVTKVLQLFDGEIKSMDVREEDQDE
ncbi:MAG: DNA polymerase III subunit gamma/tau [Myxococcales bacterium]|nr:DNA polymerase III subunit gamma/tau [Myxococcales bacterium]